jgi:hypothetical protein
LIIAAKTPLEISNNLAEARALSLVGSLLRFRGIISGRHDVDAILVDINAPDLDAVTPHDLEGGGQVSFAVSQSLPCQGLPLQILLLQPWIALPQFFQRIA